MKLPPPPGLPPALEHRLRFVEERLADLDFTPRARISETAARVAVVSDFVLGVLVRHTAELLARLEDDARLDHDAVLATVDIAGSPEPDAMAVLRRRRNVELARLAWRDIAGWASFEECVRDLSTLADAMVDAAVRFAVKALEPRFGTPVDDDGKPGELLVLGMGKLGGRELNFSSDIDLVFVYPDGLTLTGPRAAEAEDYFRRIVQCLIRLLDQVTADGFVFRVDTRLRPFGSSGPLAVSVPALESYLARHGRDWERYAYVKARLITGGDRGSELFDDVLAPFVYRRYIDFGVLESLREMKDAFRARVERKDIAHNIKLGPGGIREIEFIAQTMQILRGGTEPLLRARSLLSVLPRLASHAGYDEATTRALGEDYRFLRTVENRLQAMEDRQTQELPSQPELRERLAYALGEPDWSALEERVAGHRGHVQAEFDRLTWTTESEAVEGTGAAAIKAAWEAGTLADSLQHTPLGADPDVLRLLHGFRTSGLYRRMDEPGRQRLADVIADLVPRLDSDPHPARTLGRLLPVLRSVCRRSAYLALLNENPAALEQLLNLASSSALLSRQIAEYPLLLDELLDARRFESPPSRTELNGLMAEQVRRLDTENIEAALEAMRQFQRAAMFRIAVADRFGHLPLMKVSDRLTDTAEILLDFALDTASRELVSRHGVPMHGDPPRASGLSVVGYGKLGGLELGYGSDLDLVFMHDCSGPKQATNGSKPLDNARFFARLVQRLVHVLSVQTGTGRLYEIDMRLRPDGGAGLLVTSLESFHRYQRKHAWTWEHQALLRSRAVAGNREVGEAFERERRDVLVNHVDRERLKSEVESMRKRMRKELSQSGGDSFDLKQDAGGLADIEFLVDYWVLSNSQEYPELVEFPDNVRQLEALDRTGLVDSGRCEGLTEGYLALRQRTHELALDDAGRVVPATEFRELRDWIISIWNEVFAG